MVSFVILCVLLGLGHLLRVKSKLLQNLYLPSCIVAGLLGLLFVQLTIFTARHTDAAFAKHLAEAVTAWASSWSLYPGILINVVFACLFLGVKLPKPATLFRNAGSQFAYGQMVAWGQYVVALLVWLVLLAKFFPELPGMFAAILPIGFEGGHGTAAGMATTFEYYGWMSGKDFALTSATLGVISAIIVGMILVNWAIRRGHVKNRQSPAQIPEDDSIGVIPVDKRPSAGKLTVNSDVIETFSLHIVTVGIAIGIGYILKQGMVTLEQAVPYLQKTHLLSGFPLFPLCLFGGLIIQTLAEKFDPHEHIDIGLIRRIQNASLDFLVIAAISTIQVKLLIGGLLPLLILVLAGIAWNVFCVLVIARFAFKQHWFERSIAEMGQSMGVTATGLLLLRVVDPDYDTPAADAFAFKQLLHEPVMGGGLWTAMAVPLIHTHSPGNILMVTATVLTIWLAIILLPRLLDRIPAEKS